MLRQDILDPSTSDADGQSQPILTSRQKKCKVQPTIPSCLVLILADFFAMAQLVSTNFWIISDPLVNSRQTCSYTGGDQDRVIHYNCMLMVHYSTVTFSFSC